MPALGEIQKAKSLGFTGYSYYVWQGCAGCGRRSWVTLRKGKSITTLCRSCSARKRGLGLKEKYRHDKAPAWRGGRIKDSEGYILIKLDTADFFYSMANTQGYVREHRLVYAKYLGRCLHLWELVHHKNGIRGDNSIENLQLISGDRHNQLTKLENRIKILEGRVTLLEAENHSLKLQLLHGGLTVNNGGVK